MSRSADPPARPVAVAIFALVIAALLAATVVHFLLTFTGPPPRGLSVRMGEVLSLLNGQEGAGRSGLLTVKASSTAPVAGAGERPVPAVDARVAQALGVPAARVRGFYSAEPRGPMLPRGRFLPMPDHGPGGPWNTPPPFAFTEFTSRFTLGLDTGNGWRIVRGRDAPWFTAWHAATLAGMLAALLILSFPAWWIATAISRPIRRLARAAEEVRLGAPVLIPSGGPAEVQALARALAQMQARLAAQARERTTMLTSIAHDMGTPLARLAFWIEQLPEEARVRAAADIEEARAMLKVVLMVGRGGTDDGPRSRVDLASLIETLVETQAAAGAPVTLVPGERAVVIGDPTALRRMIANLVENAVRYGGAARIGWDVAGGEVVVRVEDDGPGFGPDPDRLFEPFARGDPSRNRGTGGTGLGLTIVRTVAQSHGGEVTLADRLGGGAVATVRLRLAQR
ncbi:MAG: sensor histidine kinase [Pseudomonadota bacterium]